MAGPGSGWLVRQRRRLHGPPRHRPLAARPLRRFGGSAAAGQGALSPARDPAPAALRHAGRSGRRDRGRDLGRGEPGLPAPPPALPARHPEPRHPGRGDRRARPGPVQGLLRLLGRGPARGGADYLLALKENRPATFGEVEAFFADPPPGSLDTFETIDGDHGRIEVRRHAVCHDVAWLFSGRRYPGEVAFPGLAMLGMVESETERGGKVERERRYYLSSATLDAASFARAVRAHWGIENRLHWVLDVVFRDDLARLRTGHGPANMAVVRHMAMNLLHQARPTVSLKNRRKRAGWNTAYLESLIRQTA